MQFVISDSTQPESEPQSHPVINPSQTFGCWLIHWLWTQMIWCGLEVTFSALWQLKHGKP